MTAMGFITQAECEKRTSLSRTTIYRMRRDGKFPDMYRLSPGRKGYRKEEVENWIRARNSKV
jgi:predicted DNA-binding transcriptional regulator AlpA